MDGQRRAWIGHVRSVLELHAIFMLKINPATVREMRLNTKIPKEKITTLMRTCLIGVGEAEVKSSV